MFFLQKISTQSETSISEVFQTIWGDLGPSRAIYPIFSIMLIVFFSKIWISKKLEKNFFISVQIEFHIDPETIILMSHIICDSFCSINSLPSVFQNYLSMRFQADLGIWFFARYIRMFFFDCKISRIFAIWDVKETSKDLDKTKQRNTVLTVPWTS